MAGYHEKSMSNNAVEAYENGLLPISKWTKTKILEYITNPSNLALAKKHSLAFLQKALLLENGWHHTSSRYNKTRFYEFNGSLDNEDMKEILSRPEKNRRRSYPKPDPNLFYPIIAHWEAWKNGKKETVYSFGRRNATWFWSYEGEKKRLSGKTLYFDPLTEDAAMVEFKKASGSRSKKAYTEWLNTGKIPAEKKVNR